MTKPPLRISARSLSNRGRAISRQLGLALHAQGKNVEAAVAYRRGLELKPNCRRWQTIWARFFWRWRVGERDAHSIARPAGPEDPFPQRTSLDISAPWRYEERSTMQKSNCDRPPKADDYTQWGHLSGR